MGEKFSPVPSTPKGYKPIPEEKREQEMDLQNSKTSFDEILRVVRLLHSIGIRPLLHTLSIVIISAITATPCCLLKKKKLKVSPALGYM